MPLSGYRHGVGWTRRGRPLRDAHLAALDLIAALAVLAALAPAMRTSAPLAPGFEPYPTPTWVFLAAWGVAAVVAVSVVLRRRWPLPALGVLVAVSAAATVLLDLRWPATLAALAAMALALYSVALTTSARASIAALAFSLVVTGSAWVLMARLGPFPSSRELSSAVPWQDTLSQAGFGCLLLAAAWATGLAVRQQRAYAASLAEQAARQALTDERHRIARELHDIVAHSMSLIAVKAGIANHVAEARPQEARDALRLIEGTSRSALVDLRRVLGVMRADTGASPELEPPPGLAGLATLRDRATSAGLQVEMAVHSPDSVRDNAVPEGVQVSAYRIVQEALTNVVKHAGTQACRVAVIVAPGEVRIEVIDDGIARGPRAESLHSGHGIVGMRERVGLFGGTFSAGPRPDGGFAVTATLPYQPITS
jgi:signal transduction histidine kinase